MQGAERGTPTAVCVPRKSAADASGPLMRGFMYGMIGVFLAGLVVTVTGTVEVIGRL